MSNTKQSTDVSVMKVSVSCRSFSLMTIHHSVRRHCCATSGHYSRNVKQHDLASDCSALMDEVLAVPNTEQSVAALKPLLAMKSS